MSAVATPDLHRAEITPDPKPVLSKEVSLRPGLLLVGVRWGLRLGLAGLLLLAPWETWSSGWPWYICMVLTAASLIAIPLVGGRLNLELLRRPWMWGLGLFLVMLAISMALSMERATSLRYFRKEMLFYLVIFFGVSLGVRTRIDLRRLILILTISGTIACAMSVAVCFYYLYIADEVTQASWVENDVILHTIPDEPLTLRAQYPLEHHNRLGFLSGLTAMLLFHVGLTTPRWRWVWWLATIIPIWSLVLALNRGGMVGLFIAGTATGLLLNWRWTLVMLVVAVLALALLLPPYSRAHFLTPLRADTYRDEMSSMTYRFNGWRGSLRIIGEHPVFGVGYSWKIFERIYPAYAVPEEVQNKPHAHNNFLEIAIETGIPGAIGFAIFQIGLIGACLLAFLRRRPSLEMAGLLGVLIYIFTVGAISYFLREQLGVIIWGLFGLAVALLCTQASDPAPREVKS